MIEREPRVVLPRDERGVLYGSERLLLARLQTPSGEPRVDLWWWRAGESVDIYGGHTPFEARLCLAHYDVSGPMPRIVVLHEGGRLNVSLLRLYGPQILQAIPGVPVERLHGRRTLLVSGTPQTP